MCYHVRYNASMLKENTMMRTQIQLTEEQARRLKRYAADQGVSVAEVIRRSIDAYARSDYQRDTEQRRQRALAVVGKYASEPNDTSVNHDYYLAEAYSETNL